MRVSALECKSADASNVAGLPSVCFQHAGRRSPPLCSSVQTRCNIGVCGSQAGYSMDPGAGEPAGQTVSRPPSPEIESQIIDDLCYPTAAFQSTELDAVVIQQSRPIEDSLNSIASSCQQGMSFLLFVVRMLPLVRVMKSIHSILLICKGVAFCPYARCACVQ